MITIEIKIANRNQMISCLNILEKYFDKVKWDEVISMEFPFSIVVVIPKWDSSVGNFSNYRYIKGYEVCKFNYSVTFLEFKTAYFTALNYVIK